jgi:hypothetical protein
MGNGGIEMTDPEVLNRLIENMTDSYFSEEALAEIEKTYGAETRKEVAGIFSELTHFGLGPWDLSEAGRRMEEVALRDYPWLSKAAMAKIDHGLFMVWK